MSDSIQDLTLHLQAIIQQSLQSVFIDQRDWPLVELEVPADRVHGDLASNIAMKSARLLRKSPMVIAQSLQSDLEQKIQVSPIKHLIQSIEVKAPGFINFQFYHCAYQMPLRRIIQSGSQFGQQNKGAGQKWQIEFVSANPTGPLSVAHARQAVVGDVLGNVLQALGYEVTKEYYVNDGGNQIELLTDSVQLRMRELLDSDFDAQAALGEDHYQGAYVIDMAKEYISQNNIKTKGEVDAIRPAIREFAVRFLMNMIETDLKDFGVIFDVWSLEGQIATPETITQTLDELQSKDLIYDQDGAKWFASTQFGDDKDRVVKKTDGSFTYLSPDIVYHKNKFERGYERLINIWGPDHHGYIPRIKAAVQALGKDEKALQVLIVQLATIYRQGEVVAMSTRRGQYITLREVLSEVGSDAARFFFLMRHINAHLEFDLELAKKQSPENPVYYVQYAHARIYSIERKYRQDIGEIDESVWLDCDFDRLNEREEINLIRKLLDLPQTLSFCFDQLDPFALTTYAHEVAMAFHKFYDAHRVMVDDVVLTQQRLGLIRATQIVLANVMRLLGVSAPKEM